MTRLFPFFFLLLLPTLAPAQNWLANGQIWTYNLTGGFAGANDFFALHAVADTVIQGQTCKKFGFSGQALWYPEERFAYADGDRVYAFQAPADSFVKIYDFSLLPGDTVRVPTLQGDLFTYLIENLDTVQAGGLNLRRQQVRYLGPNGIFTNWKFDILENIGAAGQPFADSVPACSYFFLDQFPFCNSPVDGFDLKFVCFRSAAGNFTPYPLDCLLSGTNDPGDAAPVVKIWPNPASELVFLKSSLPAGSVRQTRLLDALGRSLQVHAGRPEILHLNGTPAGVYVLVVETVDGQLYSQRLVRR